MIFKRIFIVLFLFYFVLSSINAQKVIYGIKGGLTKGTPYSKPKEEASGRLGTGPVVGAFLKRSLSRNLSLRFEFFYSYKSASFHSPVSGDTIYPMQIAGTTYNVPTSYAGWVDGSFENSYLDLPAMLSYRLGKKLNFIAGPQLSYLFKGKNTGTADISVGEDPNYPYTTVTDEPFDESSQLNRWDYGFVCGTNFETNKRLNINLNCSYGLRSIYKKSYSSAEGTVRNIYLQFSLGYRIGKPQTDPVSEQKLSMN